MAMLRPQHRFYVSALVILFCAAPRIHAKFTFKECELKFLGMRNGTIDNTTSFDPQYYGTPRGFRPSAGKRNPVMLTMKGCIAICGNSPEFHKADDAFQILTTWVLPMLALFSNLPFESMSKNKLLYTLESLVNWIGSPQSAFTTTMFNIFQMERCKEDICEHFTEETQQGMRRGRIDSAFVLSCINQYYYPRYSTIIIISKTDSEEVKLGKIDKAKALESKRNTALMYGLVRPLSEDSSHGSVAESRFLLTNLAHELRMLRRRGVYPMIFNIVWFFVAFIVSLVFAFGDLGDNTTAHSLALGIGLSWLPALILMTIIDRNPVSPMRCKILIERWLYNVNAIIEHEENVSLPIEWWNPNPAHENLPDITDVTSSCSPDEQHDSDTAELQGTTAHEVVGPPEPEFNPPEPESNSSEPENEVSELVIGDFVGQGRRLRHCGVTNTVLDRIRPFLLGSVGENNIADTPETNDPPERQDENTTPNLEPIDIDEENHPQTTGTQTRLWSRLLQHFQRPPTRMISEYTFNDVKFYQELSYNFEGDIIYRPLSWWICWMFGGVFVSVGVSMAMAVSFMTPPVGLGCRSSLWLLFWIMSSFSWGVQAVFQEPPQLARSISIFVNSVSFVLLLGIMLLQTFNGLNNCTCRSYVLGGSTFASYLDVDEGFYRQAYHVVTMWGIATSIGPLGGILPVIWTLNRWARSSQLWSVDEAQNPLALLNSIHRPTAGHTRQWAEGRDPWYWLTV